MKLHIKKTRSNKIIIYFIAIIICIISLSIGFSTYSTNLAINDINAVIRAQKNIRITDISIKGTSNNATANQLEYNVNSILSNISLPSSNSSITYNVVITNIGNVEMGILDINGLPSNLTYSISNYNLKDTLCDNSNQSICKLGSTSTIEITIRYANNGYNSNNTNYQIELNFNFARVFNITYNDFSNIESLPSKILEGDTQTITFNNTTGIPYDVAVTGASSSYNNPTLILFNPTNNVTINRYYSITYNLNGGTNSQNNPDKFLSTDNITLEDPTHSVYYFAGWYENGSFSGSSITHIVNRNNDIVLYARWDTTVTYNITYELYDGIQPNNQVYSFEQSTTQTILNPTKNGFEFGGWYKESDFSGVRITSTSQLNGHTKLYAKWIPIYTITYILNGGTQANNPITTFNTETSQTLLKPTNTHDADFVGWYIENDPNEVLITSTSQLNGDTTLYAKWVSGINNTSFSTETNTYTATNNISNIDLSTFTTNANYRYTHSTANTTINSVNISITYRSGNKTGAITCRIAGTSTAQVTINFSKSQNNTTPATGTITLNNPIPIGSSYTISCPSYTGDGNGNNKIRINGFEFKINP